LTDVESSFSREVSVSIRPRSFVATAGPSHKNTPNAWRRTMTESLRRARIATLRARQPLATDKAAAMAESSLEITENVNSDSRLDVGSSDEPHISGAQEADWRRLKGYKVACSQPSQQPTMYLVDENSKFKS
jgi:hypothetical protein